VLGQHEEDDQFPIQSLSLSYCKNILASTSHDNSIKFYDISSFVKGRQGVKEEDIEEVGSIVPERL
jgi:WD40 repeat protein